MKTDIRPGVASRCLFTARQRMLGQGLAGAFPAHSAPTDLTVPNLDQLLQATVVGTSLDEQKQDEAAAAASVISRAKLSHGF